MVLIDSISKVSTTFTLEQYEGWNLNISVCTGISDEIEVKTDGTSNKLTPNCQNISFNYIYDVFDRWFFHEPSWFNIITL
ncbi:hypothetical protein C1645_825381 [Glomus cerebriforme]|uniref:Uncharacterized protein n=1 Tax=Glomus cerebriforme TaxID=658196 RepID=A0A397SWN8_9GLOM|nr:hypothetical protein C1645_825381 [Glomus cerebriforme]